MQLRDITSVVIATTVMLICLFGVLFFFSTQCFAPSDPRTATSLQATPTATSSPAVAATATREMEGSATVTPAVTRTSAPPSPTAPAPTSTSVPQQSTPTPVSNAPADFSGAWLVVDTVTSGSGAGQTFSFEVTLTQNGGLLSGGNSGIVIQGQIEGRTATATYTQPALGLTGTFSWTMSAEGNAAGSFTSSVPNAGTSQLVRR